MQTWAFIVALIAIVLFVAEYLKTKALLALGLAVLTLAWVVQLVSATVHRVIFT